MEVCVDVECAGVGVGYELKGFFVGFARFYNAGIVVPFLDEILNCRPLDGCGHGRFIDVWRADECLVVKILDLGVGDRGYFLKDEFGFEKLYADFGCVEEGGGYGDMGVGVADAPVGDLLGDGEVGLEGAEEAKALLGEYAADAEGD